MFNRYYMDHLFEPPRDKMFYSPKDLKIEQKAFD